jgi:hypothetical protein
MDAYGARIASKPTDCGSWPGGSQIELADVHLDVQLEAVDHDAARSGVGLNAHAQLGAEGRQQGFGSGR